MDKAIPGEIIPQHERVEKSFPANPTAYLCDGPGVAIAWILFDERFV